MAADAAEDKTQLVAHVGDWAEVEDDLEGDGLDRWVPCITRGDVFATIPGCLFVFVGRARGVSVSRLHMY